VLFIQGYCSWMHKFFLLFNSNRNVVDTMLSFSFQIGKWPELCCPVFYSTKMGVGGGHNLKLIIQSWGFHKPFIHMKCSAELTLSAQCTRPVKLTSFSLNLSNSYSYLLLCTVCKFCKGLAFWQVWFGDTCWQHCSKFQVFWVNSYWGFGRP
jgi:hypothetical protein